MTFFDLWKFFAGLGLFLFGMFQLEAALKNLIGRTFKDFLRKHTESSFNSILSGTIATAILQSSSVVTLTVLAFVGAKIITLTSAIGIVLGANLGTTFTGWIVAILGFKLSIEKFATVFLALGCLGMIFFAKRTRPYNYLKLTAGFGFLFLGLGYMKVSVEHFAETADIAFIAEQGIVIFMIAGVLFTALVQSSSATMMVTLSALNADIILLDSAAAIIIGAKLGTTVTAILGSIKGIAPKKMVAMSHFLFSLVASVIGLAILYPFLYFFTEFWKVKDNLIVLVLFHSFFNLLTIALFYPFINHFAVFLKKRFSGQSSKYSKYIHAVPTKVSEAAFKALTSECAHLLKTVLSFNSTVLEIKNFEPPITAKRFLSSKMQMYGHIKQLEGEVLEFTMQLQSQELEASDSSRLTHLLGTVRNAVRSAKCIKDVQHNLEDFHQSTSKPIIGYLDETHSKVAKLYEQLLHLLQYPQKKLYPEDMSILMVSAKELHDHFLKKFYRSATKRQLTEIELSTLLNVNRELYSSNKSLIQAVTEYLNHKHHVAEY